MHTAEQILEDLEHANQQAQRAYSDRAAIDGGGLPARLDLAERRIENLVIALCGLADLLIDSRARICCCAKGE